MFILTGDKVSAFIKRTHLVARSLGITVEEVEYLPVNYTPPTKKGDVANVTGKPKRETKQDKKADNLIKK